MSNSQVLPKQLKDGFGGGGIFLENDQLENFSSCYVSVPNQFIFLSLSDRRFYIPHLSCNSSHVLYLRNQVKQKSSCILGEMWQAYGDIDKSKTNSVRGGFFSC